MPENEPEQDRPRVPLGPAFTLPDDTNDLPFELGPEDAAGALDWMERNTPRGARVKGAELLKAKDEEEG